MSLIAALFQRCDTDLNVDAPAKDYFTRFYSGVLSQRGVDMVVGPDFSTYILGTSTTTNNNDQVYIAMVDMVGDIVWQKELGGISNEVARDLEMTADGNLVIVANVEEVNSTNRDIVIYVINPASPENLVFTRTDGYAGYDDDARSVSEITGGFIVSGTTTNIFIESGSPPNPANTSDGFFFRYNDDLTDYTLPWVEIYGSQSDPDVIVKTIEYAPGLFYCFGNTPASDIDGTFDENIWIFKASQAGGPTNSVIIPNSLIPGTSPSHHERLTSVSLMAGVEGFLLTGYTSNNSSGSQQIMVMTIRADFLTKDNALLNNPKIIQSSSPISDVKASGFSSPGSFLIVGVDNSSGDENILLTKLNLDLDLTEAWEAPRERFYLGGVGEDQPAAVAETHDKRILVLGTMMLGGVTGQRKISLMKLSPEGMFGE
jgi:hypothetical protein